MLQTSPTHRRALAGQSVPAELSVPRMSAPKVSVVIPTRNRAHCLGEAIDSILAQTVDDWELIVVDDGSADETGDVMRRYCAQDSRIRYVRQPHGGCARALNTGLRLVRGDYLFKMDDDDVAHSELLAICAAGLDAHPACWAVNFALSIYHGNRKKGWTFSSTARFEPLFFRVSALRALKGWNELYAVFEDSDLRMRANNCRGWPTWQCKKPLYDYRRSIESNARQRVKGLAIFIYRYMLRRNKKLARWGVPFRPLASQTLRKVTGMLSAAHWRNGVLPSARFAHWQQRVLEEVRKSGPADFRQNVLALSKRPPRFPWAPLWRAERVLWRRLQVLRMPLLRRAEAMWDLANEYYFRREEAK